MDQNAHVGITALDAERTRLLQEYDNARLQGSSDPVATEHGVACEAHFRSFLAQFLPRKYGVTKGYIITPQLDYAGPLEEWDVIIYDAMEAPVLFVRHNRDENDSGGKRGIPVEYVRGVVEVKATFNKPMASKVANKLLKLRHFQSVREIPHRRASASLPRQFQAFAVFFETSAKSEKEYADALGALAVFWQTDPLLAFASGLIIRGQTCPGYSATISHMLNGSADFSHLLIPSCEVSTPVPSFVPGMNVAVVTGGYGPNEFWRYMIDMIHALNDENHDLPGMGPSALTGGYGERPGGNENVRLFPVEGRETGDT